MTHTTSFVKKPTVRVCAWLLTFGAGIGGLAPNLAIAQEAPRTSEAEQTIVVTATRHAMPLADAPAAMTVLRRSEIQDKGADGVLDALRGEVGVSLIGRTISGRRVLSLRGMDSRHTLILVDGKRISATDGVIGHTDFQHDWIGVEEIDRIEVIRGPMSVLYGAEALGGVVNIITRKAGDAWRGSVRGETLFTEDVRNGDGHRVGFAAQGPLPSASGAEASNVASLAISATSVRRQAVQGVVDPRVSDLEGRAREDGMARLTLRPARGHQVEAEGRIGSEDRWAVARERSGPRRYYTSTHDIERKHASIAWLADWSSSVSTQLRAYQSNLGMTNTRTNGVAALRPNSVRDQVVDGQATWGVTGAHTLTGGFELRRESLWNDGLTGGYGKAMHRSIYVQDEWQVTRDLLLTAGVRRDDHERFGAQTSPRVYAVWRTASAWVVKGGVGAGYKAPTLKQISADYREDEGPNTFYGNAAIKPETNRSWEAGVAWDTAQAGSQWMFFDNRVKNLIVGRLFNMNGTRPEYIFDNVDQATLRGLEWSGRVKPAQGLSFEGNVQWLRARDGKGIRLDNRPGRTAGVGATYQEGAWRVGLRAEQQFNMLIANPVVGQPSVRVPDVTLVNAMAAWRWQPQVEFAFGADNLFNKRLADLSPLFSTGLPPMTWRASVKVDF